MTLFEPSEKLPATLRSVSTISQGETIKIRIDNSSEDEQLIDSGWEIGTIQAVTIEEMQKKDPLKIPAVPMELEKWQRDELEILLKKYNFL